MTSLLPINANYRGRQQFNTNFGPVNCLELLLILLNIAVIAVDSLGVETIKEWHGGVHQQQLLFLVLN